MSITVPAALNADTHAQADEALRKSLHKFEVKGVPRNFAFLLRYADAVVLTKKQRYMTARYELSVSEVVWARQGIEIGTTVEVIDSASYYRDNRRHIETFAPSITSNDFSYGMPSCYTYVPSLLFIRKVSTSEKVSKNWERNGADVYKCVNGVEGSVAMPHLLLKEDQGKEDKYWLKFGKYHLKKSKLVFGSESSSLILETVRLFYTDPGKLEKMDNDVVNKLKIDSLSLMRKVIAVTPQKPKQAPVKEAPVELLE